MGGVSLSAMLLFVLAVLLVSAGVQDARTREIANWKNAAIALLAPASWWACGLSLWPDLATQLALALVVFAVFIAAFHFGWMGGGDVKMIGALALWLPLQPLLWMLIVMSLIGGVLTVVMMVERIIRTPNAPAPATQIEVPYGVAIAIAALIVIT